jgi:hypothetical protein
MYQHAVRDRVIVADDRLHKFVDDGVRLESKLLDRECDHIRKERGAGHLLVLNKPGIKTARNTLGLRHSTYTCGKIHHAFTFCDRELPQQEEPLARRGGNPVGIAATGREMPPAWFATFSWRA